MVSWACNIRMLCTTATPLISTTSISYEMKKAKKYFISYISKRVNGRPFVLPEEILYTVFEGIKYEK